MCVDPKPFSVLRRRNRPSLYVVSRVASGSVRSWRIFVVVGRRPLTAFGETPAIAVPASRPAKPMLQGLAWVRQPICRVEDGRVAGRPPVEALVRARHFTVGRVLHDRAVRIPEDRVVSARVTRGARAEWNVPRDEVQAAPVVRRILREEALPEVAGLTVRARSGCARGERREVEHASSTRSRVVLDRVRRGLRLNDRLEEPDLVIESANLLGRIRVRRVEEVARHANRVEVLAVLSVAEAGRVVGRLVDADEAPERVGRAGEIITAPDVANRRAVRVRAGAWRLIDLAVARHDRVADVAVAVARAGSVVMFAAPENLEEVLPVGERVG